MAARLIALLMAASLISGCGGGTAAAGPAAAPPAPAVSTLADQRSVSLTVYNVNLGMPLPKGTVRVYKRDAAGGLQFIGEDAIDHAPEMEIVRIKLGDAFDGVRDQKEHISFSGMPKQRAGHGHPMPRSSPSL